MRLQQPKMQGIKLALLTFGLGLGTFIQILDTSIANVAIPTIAGDLAVSPSEGTWVITSFSVANAIVLPLTGWLSRQIGVTRLFVLSTFLFGIASLLCGSAWNLPSLIFFRIVQGAVAGSLIPLSQSILLANYPKEEQGTALAIWTMIVVVAPVVGPILGGWIAQDYGWQWIFLINVPLAFISSFLCHELLQGQETKTESIPLDGVGLVLLTLSVATLQVALDKGNEWDWLNSDRIVCLLLTFIITTVYFILWNRKATHPVIDFVYFKNKNFNIGTFLITLGFLLYFAGTVIIPLWLQDDMGYTPLWAGIAVMPIGIAPIFTCLLTSRLMKTVDARLLVTISYLLFAYTFYLFAFMNPQVNVGTILWIRFLQGFAISFFFLPLNQIALFDLPKEQLPGAAGVFNFIRILIGGGIGTSLSVTFFARRTQLFHSDIGEVLTPTNEMLPSFFSFWKEMQFSHEFALTFLNNEVTRQASTICINNYFYLSFILFLLFTPLIWFTKAGVIKK